MTRIIGYLAAHPHQGRNILVTAHDDGVVAEAVSVDDGRVIATRRFDNCIQVGVWWLRQPSVEAAIDEVCHGA